MKNKIEIDRYTIITILIASLLNVFVHYLNIDGYIKNFIIPLTIMLGTYIILLRNDKVCNMKAFYVLIPIVLILISNLVVKVDYSNMILNVIVLPILLSIFFFLLTNKNYKISGYVFEWTYHLFFDKWFSNLTYLKGKKTQEKSNAMNIFKGVFIGGFFGIIILLLLMSADDYFSAFINNVVKLFRFDFNGIIIFLISFILLFSIFINILSNKNTKMKEINYQSCHELTVMIILFFINSVLLLFLVSEISRLTTNFLQLPVQYTYSSYAREGFFQLLAVTTINFSIIMYLLYKTTIMKDNQKIKNLILLLIGFSIILIFNSYYRMFLYIGNYGFTILRLQVVLFLTMEFILFIILIKKIMKELKCNDAVLYFIIMISFYTINLYLCSDNFINIINKLF